MHQLENIKFKDSKNMRTRGLTPFVLNMGIPFKKVDGYKICSPKFFPPDYIKELVSCGAVMTYEGHPVNKKEDLEFIYEVCDFEFCRFSVLYNGLGSPYIPSYKNELVSIMWNPCLDIEEIKFSLHYQNIFSRFYGQEKLDMRKAHELGLIIITYNKTTIQYTDDMAQEATINQRKKRLETILTNKDDRAKRTKI
ncbi:hypothetical protein [Burkholderia cenocepacia]|uniref:hypothetical protein n=1 Tax=Burkholderia cenocepacia TaxID=95486 RepID=UPI002ABE1A24|nr:hypothetical protein [Burkholderia cenocepacia]